MNLLDKMYSPIFFRAIYPAYERILGRSTIAKLRQFETTQYYHVIEFKEYFLKRLNSFLKLAYEGVPYYRQILKEYCNSYNFAIWPEIPFLTKSTLQEEFHNLKNINYRGKVRVQTTGGSTGHPTPFLTDTCREAATIAFRLRAHRWFGVYPGEKEIVVWGAPIELARQDYLRTIRDKIFRSRLIYAFDFGDENIESAITLIKRFKPKSLFGYAQSIFLIAKYLKTRYKSTDVIPDSLEVIFTTAEPLFEFQRETIEKAFKAKVAVEYGARDAGLIAHECPQGQLHINAESILVEIVDENGNVLPKGELGEIVVTNLDTPAMPIIRYRTGDMGRILDSMCSCGRVLPVMQIEGGRLSDFLVGRNGKRIHPLGPIYILREFTKISQFRIIQTALDKIVLELKTLAPLEEAEINTINKQFDRLLDLPVQMEFLEKDRIEVSPSGKYRHVVCQLPDNEKVTFSH